jgi:hypothetical protein
LLSCQAVVTPPSLDGVEHKFIDLRDGVAIDGADAGPADVDAGRRLSGELVGVA